MKVTTKEVNGKTYYNVKFSDIKPGTSVVVEKLYETGYEREGKFGPYESHNIRFDGQDVGIILSGKTLEKWNEMPVGMVKVSHDSEQNQKGSWYSVYTFTAVDEAEASSSSPILLSTKQMNMLKYYVDNGKTPSDKIKVQVSDTQIAVQTFEEIFPAAVLADPQRYLVQ